MKESEIEMSEALDVPKHGILLEAVQELHKHECFTCDIVQNLESQLQKLATSNLHSDSRAILVAEIRDQEQIHQTPMALIQRELDIQVSMRQALSQELESVFDRSKIS